jgi:DME family drug/metabolite transporter
MDAGGVRPRRNSAALAATMGAAVLWGTSFNVNDIGLRHVGPATFVVLRFALAGAAALLVARLLGRLDARAVRDPWMWALAVSNGVGFLLQYLGQTLTTPARTALFVNTSAFFVALLEYALFRVPVGPRRLLAITTGVAGATLLVTGGDPSSLSGGRLVGDLLVLGAGAAWSVYTVMNSRAVREGDPLNVVAWTFALSALVLAPALLLDEAPLRVPAPALLPVVYTGLVTTAAAYGLWAFGLRFLRPTTVTVLLLFEIVVATLVSVVLLRRETLGAWELAGGAILFAAVAWMALLGSEEGSGST